MGPRSHFLFQLFALFFALCAFKITPPFLWLIRIHHQSLLSIRDFPRHIEHETAYFLDLVKLNLIYLITWHVVIIVHSVEEESDWDTEFCEVVVV
jgi:hypothetical protein